VLSWTVAIRGGLVDVVRIDEALPGDGGPAGDPPPGLLQDEPAGADRTGCR
jgi:hypothetical protein